MYEVCIIGSTSNIQESVDIAINWSEENDMCINSDKTKEMLVCFVRPNLHVNGDIIERVSASKVLGVIVSDDLSWSAHVESIVTKVGKRLYVLYQLKRAGVSQSDFLRVYLSVIRPVVEYACPVWPTNLPVYLSDTIETVQKRAFRTIYPGISYSDAMEIANVPTLHQRRVNLCKDYFNRLKNKEHSCTFTPSVSPGPLFFTRRGPTSAASDSDTALF